ncbi:MAG: divergent PAP2 family protein [Candidatus Thorarchaeota archaeon]
MFLRDLLWNLPLVAAGVSWLAAQTLKPLLYWLVNRKWDWRWLYSPGGMPSAHSAAFGALATAVGLQDGVGSSTFAISLVTAIVVLYDAAGVRQSASQQARVLNQILTELFSGRPIGQEQLKELIGHTPFEVLVGAGLGAGLATLLAYQCHSLALSP